LLVRVGRIADDRVVLSDPIIRGEHGELSCAVGAGVS